ncbi:MAG: glycogen-debranching protein [Acidobacteria bacterium]|nr:glycogen-debranching protein [Acidobacteriota bacterium]
MKRKGKVASDRPTWASRDGAPSPLGVTWIPSERAYNFALYSKYADKVTLLLYGPKDATHPVFAYEFDYLRNKTGRVWHARITQSQIPDARYYAYSIEGPPSSGDRFERHAFDRRKVLVDPYAKTVFFPPAFDRTAALGSGSNAGKAPLGVLCDEKMDFEWGDEERPRHDGDLIIYEMHVRGFTMNQNSDVDPAKRGTFGGIVEKIPYLQQLGITAVELMPVFEYDDTEPNYWGYMPLNFFSPHHKYGTAQGGCRQIREFREMVRVLHKAGIEVILDVVYNHTGEGNEAGPTFSFKGIDNSTYYMASADPDHPYADYTGTGNTLHCANRAVRQLVVDSLRYWAREMHVDGFRFDLASVFSRNADGSINLDNPPIFGDIASDADLAQVRMIAEPWEGNAQYPNYELGNSQVETVSTGASCCPACQKSLCECPKAIVALQRGFPGIGWRQWNDKFRTTVRRFVKGDPGMVSDLMTRIYGSSDVFPDSLREAYRPWQSLNYVSSHDGLTLYDLVAYNSSDSWNCGDRDGEQGGDAEVMKLRKRQVKNFCCLLLISNGTPMFRAGDEFLQTQGGNANPYNIDSLATWLDWGRLEAHRDIFRFFQSMIAFRKSHPSLGRSVFWRDDVKWYGIGPELDSSYDSRSLAYCLHGSSESDDDLYVMINVYWQPISFTVQEGRPEEWKRVVDTYLEGPDDFVDPAAAPPLSSLIYTVQPRAVVVLVRSRSDG